MSRKGKVLVAMIGGIDSTVTALMLNDEGYESRRHNHDNLGLCCSAKQKETGCCNVIVLTMPARQRWNMACALYS